MTRTLAAAAALALATVARAKEPAPPGKGDVLPFPAVERTLPSGLRVIVVPTGFPEIVSVQILVQAGSRNEVEPGKTGFAHFFEHMMFRGTKAWPPEKREALLTRIGARSNGYTTDDYTNYHVTFSREDLEAVLAMEADRFQHLEYSVEAFKTESRAILGEYNKNASSPEVKLDEVQRDHAFRVHTYKHTTMGFLADIDEMPAQYDYSRSFYDRWYRPEHAAVIVAGDVDPSRTLALVEKYFSGWKRGGPVPAVPREPPPQGPVYAHVPWTSPTLPWVTVAFHAPAFSDTGKSYASLDMLLDLTFGETSDLYKKLVVDQQKVDQLDVDSGGEVDPSLATVWVRLKRPEDAVQVRDEILRAFARARVEAVDPRRLADQKSHARNAFARSLDSTETIAGTVARFARYDRSFQTANRLYRLYDTLTPQDLLSIARSTFTDAGLVVTTLSGGPLPAGIEKAPPLASLEPGPATAPSLALLTVPSKLPFVDVKLLFEAGSARDPAGKEGLSAIAADMLADAGSRRMRIEEIRDALHPLAASFDAQVDKEMVTLTGRVHRDAWGRFLEVALPQLTDPGFREEDFRRVKDARLAALVQDLRTANDEELGKERLQANLFAGTPYGHPVQGTVAGIRAVTLDDVKEFVRRYYVRANLTVAVGGDAPPALVDALKVRLAALPEGARPPPVQVAARRPKGFEVEIIEKDTRATAISFGHPIDVRRGDPDFVALTVARAWLGEHRSSSSHLYQVIREARGMNYGDYAYIEAFPRGMFHFSPDPNLGRRAQIFEVWIRPVVPQNAHMAIRLAVREVRRLVEEGLTEEQFQATRQYLMKNVFVMTSRLDQQVGYALDSRWYGIPEFTRYMREGLARLTREDVNRAVRRHLSAENLSFVVVTKDARALADALVGDGVSVVKYDAEKPKLLLDEDRAVGAMKLGIRREAVRTTPVDEVFAR